jgi:RNA polymerase sigma-70 factor (ECF subfamily)
VTFIDLDDAASFDEMYRREYPALVAIASALSGQDGPDLVHDAMVKALVNWRTVRSYQRPGGWCHRVVINMCRSRWRRRRTEERYLEQQRGEHRRGTLSVEGPSVDAIAFWSAVRQLPERPRLTVALYYAGDRSVAEIAAILDVPEGTVKSDLSRARTVLAEELR